MITRNQIQDKIIQSLTELNYFVNIYQVLVEPENINEFPSCCLVKINEEFTSKTRLDTVTDIHYLIVCYIDHGSDDNKTNPPSRQINDLADMIENKFSNNEYAFSENINTLNDTVYSCKLLGVADYEETYYKNTSYITIPISIKKV